MRKELDSVVASEYLPIIEAYLSGEFSLDQFEKQYLDKCQAEDRLFGESLYELICVLEYDFEWLELDEEEREKINAEGRVKLPGNPQYYSEEERRKQTPSYWTYIGEEELRADALKTAEALRAYLL